MFGVRIGQANFGGVDGKGKPFFSGLTKHKRTDASSYQANLDDQHMAGGVLEKMWRKWVGGRGSVPNTVEDLRKRPT